MRDHHDLEFEPIVGLPEELPEGESIVWQGRPSWRGLARETYKARWLAAYFGVLVLGRAVLAVQTGEGTEGVFSVLSMGLLSVACLGLVALLSWLQARATVYTITTERVVMRIGVALPMTWNLPFSKIQSADMVERGATGDVVFGLTAPHKIAWVYLWPHNAPWEIRRPRPAFRGLANAAEAASHLREAVAAWADGREESIEVNDAPVEHVPSAIVVGPKLATGN